jgi:hypothetical protein
MVQKLNEDITLECVIYNKEGAILVVETDNLFEEDFFGFEVVEHNLGMCTGAQIRMLGKI